MENKVRISVTEGVMPSGWNNTVRVFIANDYSYGYFVPQVVVEAIVGKEIFNGDVFFVSKEDANTLIEKGQTYGEKRFIK